MGYSIDGQEKQKWCISCLSMIIIIIIIFLLLVLFIYDIYCQNRMFLTYSIARVSHPKTE
jgi:competence protein ComGC